ncbi:VOC family protein [Epibacterium ulvae]|uniref:VOC family protein n=1 Tax=Epibacterium ulvae TaxID=1156985 RepID=UPI002490DEBF|nr:VOC family protein [Epibacterium ulvae]
MAFLGIDHPLIAVRDLDKAIETFRSLGFFIAPPVQHPWGTSTALALFNHQILEIVSIGDASLLDRYETGGFRFGRHVEEFLEKSEGVALTALFTEDAEEAEAQLAARGISCTGTIDFGRDVVCGDGKPDRTKTTLKVFRNDAMPRLSVFACQQHRRDLLEFPDRMAHPNGAHGFAAATIVAKGKAPVLDWLTRIHDVSATTDAEGFDSVETINGHWRIVTPQQFRSIYGADLPDGFLAEGPRIAALDVRVRDLAAVSGLPIATEISKIGGIAMRFVPSGKQI